MESVSPGRVWFVLALLLGALAACAHEPRAPVVVPPALKSAGSGSIADIAERCLPSVVNISSTKLIKAQRSPFSGDRLFRFFFDHPFFRGRRAPRERRQRSLGSGVIVAKAGVVLTNNHVVDKADEIRVTTVDRREYKAEVVGRDRKSDLAVLRLQGDLSGLRALPFGDSDALRLGDVVLAIGNPFGAGQTVTMGIVSAKGRNNIGIVDYEDFIRTDAAINPGNSGGPLINMRGELVGINTALVSRSGGYQGIGLAIPANMAKRIQQSILQHGKVVRGWLGAAVQDLTAELARAMGAKGRQGVLISDVEAGSPAAKADIQRGDVVLEVNGRPVGNAARFRGLIASAGADTALSLEIVRDNRERTLEVTLSESPASRGDATQLPRGEGILGGATLANITDQVRTKHDLPDRLRNGVHVKTIAPGSPAAGSGLRPGDVLIEINRQPITSVRQFRDLYQAAKAQLLLLVYRQGSTLFLLLQK